MSVLSKLTFTNLKQNKRRTFFTVLGVTLSAALMLAVAGMIASVQQTFVRAAIEATGDYHDMFENVPVEALKYVENHANVASYFYGSMSGLTDEQIDFYQDNPHLVYDKNLYAVEDSAPTTVDATANIFVRYKNILDYDHTRASIVETIANQTGADVNYRTNRLLIEYEGGLSEAAMQEFIIVGAIILTIIVVTSVFTIRNSFSISATERVKEFGMLSSVGATKRQIRWSVILEGLMIWAIGAPLGILLGVLATVVLAQVVTALLSDGLGTSMVLSIPFPVFCIAVILSFITVFLSALLPAIRTAKLSPVEAMRSSRDIKINPKKIKTSKFTREVFGVGGVIASKNLKRSRKKYRTTVVSIVLSVATFVGLATFMDQAFGGAKIVYSQVNYDLVMNSDYPEVVQDVVQKFNLAEAVQYRVGAISAADFDLAVVNQEYFEKYAKALGIETADLDDTVILNDYIFAENDRGAKTLQHTLNWQPGTEVTIAVYDDENNSASTHDELITITHVTETAALGHEFNSYPVVLVSENYAKNHQLPMLGYVSLFAKTDIADQVVKYVTEKGETDERYYTTYVDDIRESMRMLNNMYLLVAIFLYGFIAVITLIGVTNIFNTISANVALRARDFASLKSIGMTAKEFNHMIRLESLMYSTKALLIGIPIGLIISYGFYKAMSGTYDFGYSFPFKAIAIAIVAVALLIWCVMRYSVRLVNKQNIIETIRSDTV